jgi:hypothetical protein
VFNVVMKRSVLAIAASAGALLALGSGAASASVIELGATKSPLVPPSCPPTVDSSHCTIVLTRATGLETIRDGIAYPTTVKRPGVLVAFTLGLSRLSSNAAKARAAISYLDSTRGGTTQAAITVLKPVGNKKFRRWQVTAESPLFHLQPYLGTVVQFPLAAPLVIGEPPLAAPLRVDPGDVIALTVPTWAPVLTFGLNTKQFAYRQSRRANCPVPAATEQAQELIGANTRYLCNYAGTRVEYTATEVTTPVAPKNQIHAPIIRNWARRLATAPPSGGAGITP